jgi:hypothetical protein
MHVWIRLDDRMSENSQAKAIVEHIETAGRELPSQAAQFRARIEELARRPSELDAENEDPLLANAGRPTRARGPCQALDLPSTAATA